MPLNKETETNFITGHIYIFFIYVLYTHTCCCYKLKTTPPPPPKFSSDVDFGVRHGFRAIVSLLLTQSAQQYFQISPNFIFHSSWESQIKM